MLVDVSACRPLGYAVCSAVVAYARHNVTRCNTYLSTACCSGIVLGKLSGRNALNTRIKELGYDLAATELDDVFRCDESQELGMGQTRMHWTCRETGLQPTFLGKGDVCVRLGIWA